MPDLLGRSVGARAGFVRVAAALWARPATPYAIAALVACAIVLANVPPDRLVIGGDAPAPELNPTLAWLNRQSIWASFAGFGKDNAFNLPLTFPFIAFDRILEGWRVPALAVNHFWIAATFVVQAVGSVALFGALFPQLTSPAARCYCGLFAIVNPWVLLAYHAPYPALNFSVALVPAFTAALVSYVRTQRRRSLLAYLALLACALAANTNPAYVAVHAAIVVGTAGALALVHRTWSTAFAAFTAVLSYVALNVAYWIPIAGYAAHAFGSLATEGQRYTQDTLAVTSQFTTLGAAFRLVGGYLFFNPVGGEPFLRAGASYVSNPLVVVATCVPPALACAAIFLFRRSAQYRLVIGLGIVGAAALFFAKGTAPPGGELFGWLFSHVGAVQAFRDSFGKLAWITMYCYALLGAAALALPLPAGARSKLIAAAYAALVVAGFPFLSGQIFWPHMFVDIPDRYFAAAAFLNAFPAEPRIVEMPIAPMLFDVYRWGYVGAGINSNMVRASTVSREFDFGEPGTKALNDTLAAYERRIGSAGLATLTGLLSVDHIVSDRSIDVNYYFPNDNKPLSAPLGLFALEWSRGSLSIYAVPSRYRNARVYVPRNVETGTLNLEQMADVCAVLGTCRDLAFLPATALTLPPRAGHVRFDASPGAPGTTTYMLRSTVSAAPRRPEGPQQRRNGAARPVLQFVDFGNATSESIDAEHGTAVLYSDAAPVTVSVYGAGAVPDLAGFRTVAAAGAFARPRVICAAPGAVKTAAVSVPLPADSPLHLVAARSDLDASGYGWMTVSGATAGKPGSFFIPLGRGRRAVARLFSASGTIDVTFGVEGRSGSACMSIPQFIVADPVRSASWALVGGDATLDATSPYFALVRRKRVEPSSRYGVVERAPALASAILSDAATAWSPVEILRGTGNARLTPASSGATAIAASNALADSRVYLQHLAPGQRYTVRIPIRRWTGVPPNAVVVGAQGEQLGSAAVNPAHGAQTLTVAFDCPDNDEGAILYLYVGGTGASSVLVDSPVLQAGDGIRYVHLTPPHVVAAPAVTAARISADHWHVRVRNASTSFPLVLNDSYNPGWHVVAPAAVRARHSAANGFSNAWIVDGKGSYDLDILFGNGDEIAGPRRLSFALVLSALTLQAVLTMLRSMRPRVPR